ncbi:hypothetical protein GCM10023189_60310 [Nibrella saemangeumensis]|uniref:histidine kinase n=1 Tax=Nibrella saemangeumensis TaxID=1084526 RepID=A0ABP8NSX8_9BACT
MKPVKTYEQLVRENEDLRHQLDEATETLHAIRTGQVDALVVQGDDGHQLYTLKTADQTYRVFIETMNEGAVTLNEQGVILYSNSMFAALVDKPLSKVTGVYLDTFIAAESKATYAELFRLGWAQNSKAEILIRNANGDVPCLASVKVLKLDEGMCLSLIITNLTGKQEAQKRLEETVAALERSNYALNRSNENLQQFAYVASHDLQEPLRKIQSFGNLLKSSYATQLGTSGEELVTRMEVAAERMSYLIRDLLTFSRLTTSAQHQQQQDLNKIVADVLAMLEMVIQEKQAVIKVGELATVPGDATQLGQLIQNLLTNALKFTKPGVPPRIRVSCKRVERTELPASFHAPDTQSYAYCMLQVSDNGIGFASNQAERIFGTFQRLHGKNEYPGTGIGLAIAKKVVENHRGYIEAESQPGEGATFRVYLPL